MSKRLQTTLRHADSGTFGSFSTDSRNEAHNRKRMSQQERRHAKQAAVLRFRALESAKLKEYDTIRTMLRDEGGVILTSEDGDIRAHPATEAAINWLSYHSIDEDRHHSVPGKHSHSRHGVSLFESREDSFEGSSVQSVWLRNKLPSWRDVFDAEGNVTNGMQDLTCSMATTANDQPLYVIPTPSDMSAYGAKEKAAVDRRNQAVVRGKVRCHNWLTSLCAEHAFLALLRDQEQSTDFWDVFQAIDLTKEQMEELKSRDDIGEWTLADIDVSDDLFTGTSIRQ